MDKDFKACAVCTSTCFKEHGADGSQQTAPNYARPPCFLITSLEVSNNWTPIPREFVESHGETLRGPARIFDSNAKEWSVEIGGPGKMLGFKGGWKSFVASTSVKRGDQMLFSLISKSCFSVHVFNKLGVEVVPAPPVETKPSLIPASGKRKSRLEVKPEPVSEEDSDGIGDSSDSEEYEASKSDAESPSESDTEGVKQSTVEEEEMLSESRKVVKRKFTGSSTEAPTAANKSHYKTKKNVRVSTTKGGMYIEPGSCTTTYESRRRKVTAAELERAIERGRALKTDFPSVSVVMMPSHVYRGFWLTIPGRFSKEFMPQEKIEVKLRDKHGFDWVATWIRSVHHTGLSGGWAAFSKDHCLEEGDVCVFEVIDSEDWVISVHIVRVVDVSLKPGTRGGWEKTYNIVHGALMHQPGAAKKFKSRSRTTTPPVKRSRISKSSTLQKKKKKSIRKRVSIQSDTDESGEEEVEEDGGDSDVEEDDLPLTKLYKEKGGSDVTSEEVDVKPKILSMGPIPKLKQEPVRLVKVKQEPGLSVKVKQEPGVPCEVKLENGIHSRDVKPSREELRASLSQGSSVTAAASVTVKPEPVETEGRKWHPVVRMLLKRHDGFLVNLGPRVICTSDSCSARDDGNGNWWVPRSQFSSDLGSCYID